MSRLWRHLFRDNPMNIESLRAVRRFTTLSGSGSGLQKNVIRVLLGVVGLVYAWLLLGIAYYREDMSAELMWLEFLLLTFLVPMTLYGAISGERERLTWDSLILTRLSPARILVGKLLWRLGMAAGVILLFQPPLLMGHYLNKFRPIYAVPDMLWVQLCLLCWCVFLAAFTLWVSARTKRSITTLSAVVIALLGLLVLVPGLFTVFGGNAYRSHGSYSFADGDGNIPALMYVGATTLQLNPGHLIWALSSNSNFLSGNTTVWYQSWGQPLVLVAPVIYLCLAALCILGTLRALARLGLPTGGRR